MRQRAATWVPSLPAMARATLALACLTGAGLLALRAAPPDPVEDLRQALPMRLDEIGAPTPAILDYRRDLLQKKVAALKTVGELRRALALEEWKEDTNRVINKNLQAIDSEMRNQVADRLTQELQRLSKTGDPTSRLAVANLIAEMGPTIRSPKGDRFGFARTLTPEVIRLVGDKDLAVRQEAIRALGNIFPKPNEAVPVLEKVLNTGALGPKRLAADSLAQLVRVVNHLAKRGRASSGVESTRQEVLETSQEVVKASAAGIKDEDPQVRALSYKAMQVAAQALADMIPDGLSKKEFPPEGRKLTDEERKYIVEQHEFIQRELRDVQPFMDVLKAQADSLAQGLEDSSQIVRHESLATLETVGVARLRIKRRVVSVPVVMPADEGGDKGNRALMASIDPLQGFLRKHLSALTKLLSDPDVRLRRGAIDVLETFEEGAVPALGLLNDVLLDENRFVRWSAARAIGNIGPEKALSAVPYLAKLLEDSDLNVRLAASTTLSYMGPLAQDALPALAQAVTVGDAECRIGAMYALQAMGPEIAKAAAPQLAEAMSSSDPRVRRLAAETLGRLGRAALPAVPILRRALGDDDQDVRVAASDAILSILGGANGK